MAEMAEEFFYGRRYEKRTIRGFDYTVGEIRGLEGRVGKITGRIDTKRLHEGGVIYVLDDLMSVSGVARVLEMECNSDARGEFYVVHSVCRKSGARVHKFVFGGSGRRRVRGKFVYYEIG